MYLVHKWNDQVSTDVSNRFLKRLALQCTDRICDQGLKSYYRDMLNRDDFVGLCNATVDYVRVDANDARWSRQLLAFYSKREDLDIGCNKRLSAVTAFGDSEKGCRETNNIFRRWSGGSFSFEPQVERALFIAQRKIASVLGDVPSLSSIKARFGPGATTQLIKRTASSRRKLGQTFACSEDLVPVLGQVLEELPLWISPHFVGDSETATVPVEIHTGTVSFVPKNAKTLRTIVVEPSLNSFFQIGIGDYIAERLRSVGLDIRDQTRNQSLAKEASVTGLLATLDLSAASDSIARELVAHLLPIDWFLFLDLFRTSVVTLDGETMKLQKFSSMGNGFTFPLETLIFWALSVSVTPKDEQKLVSVYGDDIIVPTHVTRALVHLLHVCGFSVNIEKSFASGPFRESCGKDYYSGILIRPVYVKDRLSGESLFTLHNFFVRCDEPELASCIMEVIHPDIRIWGPDGYGDGHLIGDHARAPYRRAIASNPRVSSGWSGYTFDTFTWKGRKDYKPYIGDFVFPGYSIYLSSSASNFEDSVRGIGKDIFHDIRAAVKFWGLSPVTSFLGKFHNCQYGCSSYNASGSLGSAIPGKKGYKRISIYTLG